MPTFTKGDNKVHGLNTVLRTLDKRIREIENHTYSGLIRAALLVRRDMDKTPPLIPVDTNYLRSSWFIEPVPFTGGKAILMGFSAHYAIYVHEMVGANFKRSGAGAKFFEASLNRNRYKILKIIRDEARRAK